MIRCNLCGNTDFYKIYQADRIPVFQNKVYPDEPAARNVKKISIELVSCKSCGFIFNKDFRDEELDYDSEYQNQQTCFWSAGVKGTMNNSDNKITCMEDM